MKWLNVLFVNKLVYEMVKCSLCKLVYEMVKCSLCKLVYEMVKCSLCKQTCIWNG